LTVIFLNAAPDGAALGDTRLHWLLCSFQGPRRAGRRRRARQALKVLWRAGGRPVSQNSTACGHGHRARSARHGLPGPVDMLETGCAQERRPLPASPFEPARRPPGIRRPPRRAP